MDPTKPREPPISLAEKFWEVGRSRAVTLAKGQEIELGGIAQSLEIEARGSSSAIRLKLTARREIEQLPFPWRLGIAVGPRLDAIEKIVISELDRPALLVLSRAPGQTAIVIVISYGDSEPATFTRALALDP